MKLLSNPNSRLAFKIGLIKAIFVIILVVIYQKFVTGSVSFEPRSLVLISSIIPVLTILPLLFIIRKHRLETHLPIKEIFLWYASPLTVAILIIFLLYGLTNIMGSLFGWASFGIILPILNIIFPMKLLTIPYIFFMLIVSYLISVILLIIYVKKNISRLILFSLGLVASITISVFFIKIIPMDTTSSKNQEQCIRNLKENPKKLLGKINFPFKSDSITIDVYVDDRLPEEKELQWSEFFIPVTSDRWEIPEKVAAKLRLTLISKISGPLSLVGAVDYKVKCVGTTPTIYSDPSLKCFKSVYILNDFLKLVSQKKYKEAKEYLSKKSWNDSQASLLVEDLSREIQSFELLKPIEGSKFTARFINRNGLRRVITVSLKCEGAIPKIKDYIYKAD